MSILTLTVIIAIWLAMAVLGLLLYQLILQNGRILLRLEALEQGTSGDSDAPPVEDYVASLPAGVPAPPIILPDTDGVVRSLSDWRGSRVLLVFMDPNCAFSRKLLPSLVALNSDPVVGRPVPIVVSTGGVEENRALFDAAAFPNPVLLQAGAEAAAAYKVDGTPMSYLIEADGTIAGELAVGVQAVLIQAGEIASVADGVSSDADAGLSRPVVLRTGLRSGAKAPSFRLPRVDGGELSLLDYRSQKVVVVFSDPECVPCAALMPLLEAAHRDRPGLGLLMISRGDVEAMRRQMSEQRVSFPVAMQRHWEISRQYGIFATPAAFLIDEWGVISADVAVGNDAILGLMKAATEETR